MRNEKLMDKTNYKLKFVTMSLKDLLPGTYKNMNDHKTRTVYPTRPILAQILKPHVDYTFFNRCIRIVDQKKLLNKFLSIC